jgi:hypothetical protein
MKATDTVSPTDVAVIEAVGKLGCNQSALLKSLCHHGAWYEGCGWSWGSTRATRRLLDTLVRRKLAYTELKRYAPLAHVAEFHRRVCALQRKTRQEHADYLVRARKAARQADGAAYREIRQSVEGLADKLYKASQADGRATSPDVQNAIDALHQARNALSRVSSKALKDIYAKKS